MNYSNLKPQGYVARLFDTKLSQALQDFGAVEICGTRWSGKSWTAAAFAESVVRVDENAELYRNDPSLALIGALPHAIDEWQDAPAIWNQVRHRIDDTANQPGSFILTGSSSLKDNKELHSGAGRIARLRMRTMTLQERGLTCGTVSLAGLFEGRFEPQESRIGLDSIAEAICHGGWPALMHVSAQRAQSTIEEYLDLLFEVSMRNAGKNPILARRIARSLARNLGTPSTLKTLATDAAAGGSAPSDDTVSSYLSDFTLQYFLDEIPGWDAPVRARSRVRTKPKRYLDDPSMAAALLSINADRLIADGQLFGVFFEALCIHDLNVFASLLPEAGANPLHYYADADGLEVDVIIELRDGRWAAIEIKLGEAKVDVAAKNLKRLEAKVAGNPAARNRHPEFMAVLVGKGAYAHRRKEDGIYVIPLDTLTA